MYKLDISETKRKGLIKTNIPKHLLRDLTDLVYFTVNDLERYY